ncbi:MAG: RNA-binding protein [Nanoarchaeota archaeon]|nr:RNA-binding protein [Nanoarchaeota archaeon]
MRKQFSKSDIKQFLEQFPFASSFMDKKSDVVQEDDVLLVNKESLFLNIDGEWVPSLKFLLKKPVLPKVVVDKGAIRFVVNGADIMRPGITACDSFEKDSFVVIVDETVGKPIAVGKCLLSSEDLMKETGGKHIKNLHYVGDDFWSR